MKEERDSWSIIQIQPRRVLVKVVLVVHPVEERETIDKEPGLTRFFLFLSVLG
jgi:hypothetical protein